MGSKTSSCCCAGSQGRSALNDATWDNVPSSSRILFKDQQMDYPRKGGKQSHRVRRESDDMGLFYNSEKFHRHSELR